MLSLLAVLYLFQICAAVPADPGSEQWCFYGCDQACDYNTWAGSPNASAGYYSVECQNFLKVSSVWACTRKYCSPSEEAAGYEWMQSYCQFYGGVDILPPSIISNLTDEDINNLPILDFGSSDTVNGTSLPDRMTFDAAYRTGAEYYTQVAHHVAYSHAMFIFWGVVVGLGTVHNLLSHLGLSLPLLMAKYWTKVKGTFVTAPFTTLQADGMSASLFESLMNLIFVIINVVLCAVNYTAFDGNIFWSTIEGQTLRYLADRTGYISYANLTIFWLFGIRNNLLIWMTGWQFATFTRFHRVVAFVCTVEAIIHSGAYSYSAYIDGGNTEYLANFTQQYWNCGVAATVAMSFSIILSIPWIRVRWYDFFLIVHIVLAVVAIAMLYYHTAIFDGEFDGFIWACVAFWVFDRVIRVGRILCNLVGAQSTQCLVEYDQDSDVVRIDVTKALGSMGKDVVAAYYYVYFLYSLKAWESHPFTVTRWKDDVITDKSASQWRYTLMIRPHNGFTKRLARQSLRGPVNRRMLFEGPYGAIPSSYDQIVNPSKHGLSEILYIIGGSGISVAISSVYALLFKEALSAESEIPRIKMIWAVPKRSFLESVLDRELRVARADMELEAHITRDAVIPTLTAEPGEDLETKETLAEIVKESKESSGSVRSKGALTVSYGRPRVDECVLNAVRESKGIVGIVVCGPMQMMKDVRSAVVMANHDGTERCRVFSEDFAW